MRFKSFCGKRQQENNPQNRSQEEQSRDNAFGELPRLDRRERRAYEREMRTEVERQEQIISQNLRPGLQRHVVRGHVDNRDLVFFAEIQPRTETPAVVCQDRNECA